MSYRPQSHRSTSQSNPLPPAPSDESSTSSSAPLARRKRGVSQVDPINANQHGQHPAASDTNNKKPRTTKTNGSTESTTPTAQPNSIPKRTRPSNNEHPALRPGVLTKLHEPREEIAARAAGKRAEGEAKKEKKAIEQAEKRKGEEKGKSKIAAAMNKSEREMKEREDKSKLPFGGNIEVEAFNGGFDARAVRKDSAGAQAAPLTATEKKKLRTESFLSDVAAYRQGGSVGSAMTLSKTSSSKSNADSQAAPPSTTQPKKTLNSNWRSKIQPLQGKNLLGAASPTSKTAATTRPKGRQTAKAKAKNSKGKARKDDEVEVEDDEPVIDALREKETGIGDELLEKFDRDGVGHDQFQVDIFEVDNDTLQPKTESKTKKENKSNRRPKTAVSVKKSRAFETMPQWAQDKWLELRATVCHMYGEDSRPFKLGDGRDCRFARDVEAAVRLAVPTEADFEVNSTGDKVYARLRQGIYEWRDDYYEAVIKLADVKLTALHKKLGVEKMRVWVEKALSAHDGAAYWDVPGTEATPARGSLRSEYIVAAFATHIKNTKLSAREADAYPIGALALSCAAVQRCFETWLPGVPPNGYPPFSEQNVSSLVEDYATGAGIQALVAKSHRFDDLIERALRKLDTPEPTSKSVSARNKSSTHKAAVVIEPSSEPEHDEEVADEDEDDSAGEDENKGESAMDVDGDVTAGEREDMNGGEVTVKEEDPDFGGDYFFQDRFRDDGDASGAASAGRSTPHSVFSLEVDGFEIVSEAQTRSGSLEPPHSRGPSSPSLSLLSID